MAFVHIGRHSYKKGGLVKPMKPDEAPKDIMQVGEREMVTGCCFAMKASLFKYIGGFNHNYRIGYWEDSEICMNVRELGYKILFTPESVIYHKLGHTGSGGHNYFNQNRNYFFNKWVKSNRIHKLLIPPEEPKDKLTNILIKRTSAHGDVLVASGVCAALKQQHPGIKITFCTNFQEVIQDNPYIDEFVEISKKPSADIVYNLDMVYEMRPQVNILDAYAEYCGVNKKDCDVFLNQKSMNIDLPENFIVIHAGKTDWAGRDWPHERFIEIANQLLESGEKIIAVGKYSEGEIPCTINLKGKTNIAELAWVMKQSKLFIGIDSFPMHVAQAVDIPGVCFFGSIKPELRIYNEKMHGITANNLDCLGCHHKKFGSTVTKICENGTLACIKNVSSEDMMKKIREIIS
jgi:ADP-heptose:LPS heptosyltransferase